MKRFGNFVVTLNRTERRVGVPILLHKSHVPVVLDRLERAYESNIKCGEWAMNAWSKIGEYKCIVDGDDDFLIDFRNNAIAIPVMAVNAMSAAIELGGLFQSKNDSM